MSEQVSGLALTATERAALGRAALDWCLSYFDAMAGLAVYPKTSAKALSEMLDGPVPEDAEGWQEVMAQFSGIAEHARHNGHPRMFGYVQSSGTFAGAIADLLASALNQNVTSWRSAPSATTIERVVTTWIATMVGAPASSAGILVSGGSAANLAALATALRSSVPIDVARIGVAALDREPRIYASSMVHMSIPKAAGLLGLGRDSVQAIPVDSAFQMEPGALDAQLGSDRAANRLPICVVATAGDVNTGAIDPLDAIADVCARHGVWLHVDASYGGFAALAPAVRARLSGMARADSIALDPHKWLFAPLDAGCVLVRDLAALRRAFAQGAAYVDVIADDQMSDFAFWDHGPELSRRFRGLKIWFALKLHGARAFAEAIDANLRVAQHLADAVDACADLERLAPVPLSIVCFRYVPPDFPRPSSHGGGVARDELNTLNRRIMLELQREGEAYVSNADLGGVFALRACITNFRTTPGDTDRLLTSVRRIGERLWYAQ